MSKDESILRRVLRGEAFDQVLAIAWEIIEERDLSRFRTGYLFNSTVVQTKQINKYVHKIA